MSVHVQRLQQFEPRYSNDKYSMIMNFVKYKPGARVRVKANGYTLTISHVIINGYTLRIQMENGESYSPEEIEYLG